MQSSWLNWRVFRVDDPVEAARLRKERDEYIHEILLEKDSNVEFVTCFAHLQL